MGERRGVYTLLEDPAVDGRKILKRILKKLDENTDWINLAQEMDSWRAVVNAVMNSWFP